MKNKNMKNFSLIDIVNGRNLKESENINQKSNVESDVDEQVGREIKNLVSKASDFGKLSDAMKLAFKDVEVAIGLNKNPIKLGKKSLTTADEIFNAIKDGSLTSGKELGRVEKGFLKSRNTDSSLRKTIAIDFAKDRNVLNDLTKSRVTNATEIKKLLKDKGYADESIKEILSQMKSNGTIDAKGSFVWKSGTKSSEGLFKKSKNTKPSKSLFGRTKELLNNIKVKKMTWKQLLVWGAALGIGATALWWFINDNSDTVPEGMPKDEPTPTDDWPACMSDLITQKKGQIAVSPKGEVSILLKSTNEYPGGLQFYPNKRVLNVQTKETGTWSCNGSTATISEIVNRVLNEQVKIDAQLNKDVEEMIDLLDFPVTKSNLKDAYNLLLTYAKNGKGKAFLSKYEQSGHGFNTSLSTTIALVYTSDSTSVDYKNNIKILIEKIESGTYKSETPESNTKGSGFKIIWDKNKKLKKETPIKTGGDDSLTNKKKLTGVYKDCEGQDFPLVFGCKSSKIKEVQKCIGVVADGKLGPNTIKALLDNKYDTSTGLSKDVYDMVMKNCGNEKKTEPIKTEPLTGEPTNIPKTNGGPSDMDYYKSLVNQGYIKGDSRETVLADGTTIPPSNRVKYKGPDLDSASVSKLDNVLNGMGYDRIKQKLDKSYGDKYVWKKK